MAVLAVFDQEWGGGSRYWMHGRRCRGRDANRRAGSWEVPPRSTRKGFPKGALRSTRRANPGTVCTRCLPEKALGLRSRLPATFLEHRSSDKRATWGCLDGLHFGYIICSFFSQAFNNTYSAVCDSRLPCSVSVEPLEPLFMSLSVWANPDVVGCH